MTRRLAEVARYVGVSEATVSRVLNGKPGISDATRQAVLTALDVLGYERPTKLRGERARLVGLVMPELQNPIFPAFAEVVAGALSRRGFTPVLCTRTVDGVSESDYVDMLLDQQVSGVIFSGGLYAQAAADHEHYFRLRERGLPAVLVNAAIDDIGFPCVATDDGHAVDQAHKHLASLGHERIGMVIGPADHVPSNRKLAAFAAAGGDAGLVERTIFSMEGGHAAANRVLGRGATGIICASDVLALGAVRAARRIGLSVPGDVSIVGFDDLEIIAEGLYPGLTTLALPHYEMGAWAVEQLYAQIDAPAGTTAPVRTTQLRCPVVRRASVTSPPP